LEKPPQIDPRIQRSKQLLIDALASFLKQHRPLNTISVKDITQIAQVNRSTFYAHYADKYELFNDCLQQLFRQMLQERLPCSTAFTYAGLQLSTITTCEFMAKTSGQCSPVETEMNTLVETQIQRLLYEYLVQWLNQGADQDVRVQTSVTTTAMMLSWSIFGAAMHWSRGESQQSIEALANDVLKMIHDGYFVLPEAS